MTGVWTVRRGQAAFPGTDVLLWCEPGHRYRRRAFTQETRDNPFSRPRRATGRLRPVVDPIAGLTVAAAFDELAGVV